MRRKAANPTFLHIAFSLTLLAIASLSGKPAKAIIAGPPVIDGITAFQSNGHPVRVDMFVPRDQAHPLPAVVLLHGASGVGGGNLIYGMAEALAETGLAVFAVHYFDAIPRGNRASISRYFERDTIIADAIDYVSSLHFVDGNRIGIFGYSLGAFQALERAHKDSRVRAVVAAAGGLDGRRTRDQLGSMPPTLILHGDRDGIVSVRRAHQVAQVLESMGAPYELEITHGTAHVPQGQTFDFWMSRAADFFHENLAPLHHHPTQTVLLRAPGRR
ncbi:MAG TPA: dienelactone hydrolase family protein [Kiloniellales bacterium]|nr:dienelactone hydrolase family protein [Kiloniellales bacterium]